MKVNTIGLGAILGGGAVPNMRMSSHVQFVFWTIAARVDCCPKTCCVGAGVEFIQEVPFLKLFASTEVLLS